MIKFKETNINKINRFELGFFSAFKSINKFPSIINWHLKWLKPECTVLYVALPSIMQLNHNPTTSTFPTCIPVYGQGATRSPWCQTHSLPQDLQWCPIRRGESGTTDLSGVPIYAECYSAPFSLSYESHVPFLLNSSWILFWWCLGVWVVITSCYD